jgi:dienelactone hydrolase
LSAEVRLRSLCFNYLSLPESFGSGFGCRKTVYRDLFACLIFLFITVLISIPAYSEQIDEYEDAANNVKYKDESIDFKTADGVKIFGTFYRPEKLRMSKVPVVLLLHQVGGSRSDYSLLVPHLMAEGYTALAIDFRGHGESLQCNGVARTWEEFNDADFKAMANDVMSAIRYLETRSDVNIERIAIIGASIGANLALNYAITDKRVRTLILLSPSLDYHSVYTEDAASRYGTRAVLVTACKDDQPSGTETQTLFSILETVAHPSKLKLYDGQQHGTQILSGGFGFDMIIMAWLGNNLMF